jgi:hypothetical protein
LVTNLIKGITGVGDELTKENLLVGVESVDDCAFRTARTNVSKVREKARETPAMRHKLEAAADKHVFCVTYSKKEAD